MDAGLAQLGELFGSEVDILDPQLPPLCRLPQVAGQPVADQLRARAVELRAKLRETVALGHADAEHAVPEL